MPGIAANQRQSGRARNDSINGGINVTVGKGYVSADGKNVKKKGKKLAEFRCEKQRRASFTTRRAQMPLSKSSPNKSCRGICTCNPSEKRKKKKKNSADRKRKEEAVENVSALFCYVPLAILSSIDVTFSSVSSFFQYCDVRMRT